MSAIVVPFRGANGKSRLPEPVRAELALAMLADVLFACTAAGATTLVTDDAEANELAAELGVATAPDPGGGQGAAVAAVLTGADQEPPVLVVNADVPAAQPRDLLALLGAMPVNGMAIAEAEDGTTNALAIASAAVFAPLYGPGSAERFRAHAASQGVEAVTLEVPALAVDVDTVDELAKLPS